MVAKCRTVRLAQPPATESSSSDAAADDDGSQEVGSLRNIVGQQRQQQVALFRAETARLRHTNADLQRLSRLRETAEVKHPPPWSPELVGCEKLLTDEVAWREYERRYLMVAPPVQLPPPQEVDIGRLTARLTGEQPMLPTPDRTCAQGFFPPAGRTRLAYNEPRLRSLVPGCRLPNTVIIRLLWSTRTLLDVEYYRAMENRRMRRRQHWEYFEWSDSDELEEEAHPQDSAQYMTHLENVAIRRRNKLKISMVDHDHVENWLQLAASGVDGVGAAPDSEDEVISKIRQRRLSRRGQLRSDLDGSLASQDDAYMPAFGRFTCGARASEKKQRRKKVKEDGADEVKRPRRRRRKNIEEGSAGENRLATIENEYSYSDDDEDWEYDDEPTEKRDDAGHVTADAAGARRDGSGGEGGAHPAAGTTPARQPQTGYGTSPASSATGPAGTPGPQTSPAAAGRQYFTPAGGTSLGARAGQQADQQADRQQLRRPSRRAGSVSPSASGRGRTSVASGGEKTVLNTSRVRPDMDAAFDSETSGRSPPPRRQALRMPHLFEVKDYVCEDSKLPGKGPTERGMSFQGPRRALCMRRGRQGRRSGDDADADQYAATFKKWSSSKIPGIFYDSGSDDEYGGDEASTLSGTGSKVNIEHLSGHLRSGSPSWKSRSPTGSGPLHELAIEYSKSLLQHEWAQDLLHGANPDILDPWEAAERMVKRLPRHSFEIQQDILHEVRTIYETFPAPEHLHPISTGILASLYTATDDIPTLIMATDTLVLLADQMDVVMASILTLLTLERLDVRDCIETLLERLGLVDPHKVVLREALSWAPRGKHRNRETCLKEINRKALSFVSNWMQAFEAHTKLIAEEVNKRKMDAVVKYNIIKILKNYEPLAIEETDEGINVNLREPSSSSRLKNPEVIEVLNYFVEMTDDEDELGQARGESGRFAGRLEVSDPLEWRRNNKDILVPPSPSPVAVVQGNRSLASGVLRPTALVTHWQGVPGLAPGPWPTVTVGIRLRIADKYYRGLPAPGAPMEFH
ncbi:uncharacterized protein LOC122378383 [Amphibalanus amphitrite]|uniref:uncharacterized protein LOC122378383 n=1 Tax=Amphibalanus amphitrite TaxID=1232801 RepID=UPI001C90CE69|nr:uncharacterized protein LOC122378383 [Amphibalanus amphitrite]